MLVVVLALAMIAAMSVGLVACNNDKGDGGGGGGSNTTLGVKEYFQALWDSAKHIGGTELTPSDDIAFDFTMGIRIGTMTEGKTAPDSKIDLGAKVSIILDRVAPAATAAEGDTPAYKDGTKTSAKIQLFDAAKGETKGNILTAYYFFNDQNYAYIDFKCQQVKVAFDTGLDNSAKFNGFLSEVQTGMKSSIDSAINSLIASTGITEGGSSWSLDAAINAIVGLVADKDVITDLLTDGLGAKLLGFLKIDPSAVMDANGNLTIGSLLGTTDVGGMLFAADKTKFENLDNGGVYYETKMGSVKNFIAGLGDIPAELKTLIAGDITLSFTTDSNKNLDNFELFVAMDNIANSKNQYPFVRLNISELKIDKAPDLASMNDDTALGINKADFKETFDLGAEVGLGFSSLKLNLSDNEQIDLSGDFSLKLNANIDLATAAAADNKSVLYGALVKKGATDAENVNIAELYFKGGQLILKVNNEAKGGTVPYTKAVFELTGPSIIDFFANFKTDDLNLKAMLKGVAAQIAVGLFNATTEAPATDIDSYNKVEDAPKADGAGTETYYYKPNYNSSFQGLIINNINLVDMFQAWAEEFFGSKQDTPPAEPELDDTVFNGVYNNGADKAEAMRYYKATDNQRPVSFTFGWVLERLTNLITIAQDGSGFSINSIALDSLLPNLLTIGKVQSYTDEACTQKGEMTKLGENLSGMDSILAYWFARNQALVKAFTNVGLISKYKDTTLYQNVNMLNAADTKLIFDCISGNKTYSQLTESQKEAITEDAFNAFLAEIQPKSAPFIIKNKLAGNESIVKDKDANGEYTIDKTPYQIIKTLFAARVSASANLTDNGFLLVANAQVTEAVKIKLTAELTLTAGKDITGSVTAPSDTSNWIVVDIPSAPAVA